jgi:hypothetical protein
VGNGLAVEIASAPLSQFELTTVDVEPMAVHALPVVGA